MNSMNDGFAFPPESRCADIGPLLPLVYSDEISPDDLLHVRLHLETCEQCHERYKHWGDLIAKCRQLLAPAQTESEESPEADFNLPSFQDILRAVNDSEKTAGDEQRHSDDPPPSGQIGECPNSMVQSGASSSPSDCVSSASSAALAQPHGSLLLADSPDMRGDSAYSAEIAECLRRAYRHISSEHYEGAVHLLLPLVGSPIARCQAMRAHYYLGLSFAALGDYSTSTIYLDEAADWAICSDNMFAVAQIGHALGENHYFTLQCSSAIEYYSLALDALNMVDNDHVGIEDSARNERINLRITAMLRLASQFFLLADFEEAKHTIANVRTLLLANPETSQSLLHGASVSWISALLNRWRGDFAAGIKDISEALDVFKDRGSSLNSARAHIATSDIILDVVDRPGFTASGSALARFAQLAEPYMMYGLRQAHDLGDTSGEFMAGLAHIRFLRATNNQGFDRVTILESMIRQVEPLEQPSLLGQVYTALGDEFFYRDELEQAGNCYRNALTMFAETDIPAYSKFAHRALHAIREGLVAVGSGNCM